MNQSKSAPQPPRQPHCAVCLEPITDAHIRLVYPAWDIPAPFRVNYHYNCAPVVMRMFGAVGQAQAGGRPMNAPRRLLAVLALASCLLTGPVASAAGDYPPRTIRATVQLSSVYCAAGCCCGQAATIYRGHWYSTPRGYCKWFRPLREGQVVTTTLYRVR